MVVNQCRISLLGCEPIRLNNTNVLMVTRSVSEATVISSLTRRVTNDSQPLREIVAERVILPRGGARDRRSKILQTHV